MCIGFGFGPTVGSGRDWLVRRAGAQGVSRPRWLQSRSLFGLPGPAMAAPALPLAAATRWAKMASLKRRSRQRSASLFVFPSFSLRS